MFVRLPFPYVGAKVKLSPLIWAYFFLVFRPYARTVSAMVMLYNDSLPSTLTPACSDALLTDVAACDRLVRDIRSDFFYPPASLSRICTDSCSSSLATWVSSVRTGCGNQTIVGDLEIETAAVYIPALLQYSFQSVCLQDDNGRYCGPVAALAAAFSDPGVSFFNYISNITDQDQKPDDYDICIVERLRLLAGSPYSDGPIVASESLYESMTSSCSITGRPITKTTLDYFTATPTPTASTCEGSAYTIGPEDDCYTISRNQGVGTAWLLTDNNLDAYCNNFPPANTVLCITNECTTVTVGINETCAAIASAADITEAQFHAWNPVINYSCSNLKQMNGTEVYVDAPGRKFVAPTDTSGLPPITPTVPAATPTDVAEGSGEKPCGRWYEVQKGDYCNLLTLKFGIALADFLFLNTGVNTNCTNLFADESYCVQAVGDINTYSGRPGYMTVTIDPSATFTGVPFTQLPNATASPYARLYTPLPTATGTRDDCVHYFPGDDYQNVGLGDVTSPSCAFEIGVRYCGSWYLQNPDELDTIPSTSDTGTPTETPTGSPTSPTPPAPTMSGEPENCNKWAVVKDGVLRTAGQPDNCSKWDRCGSGDYCDLLASRNGLTVSQLAALNPVLGTAGADCGTQMWFDYYYCVAVSG
ncbi:carbohydrate-binding module family 50 protein [Hypoxylon sp. CI-4A]|nr:carbohydrate-binding module family 50 protein [Hypoxylon sp. CI-4A]